MSDDRQDRVRRRAYEMWEEQGGEHGRHEDHWHRASAEIGDEGDDKGEGQAEPEQVVAAPDGTTLTVSDEAREATDARPARKRAAPKPAPADKPAAAAAKPRKPKAK